IIRLRDEWNRDIDIVIEIVANLIYFLGLILKYVQRNVSWQGFRALNNALEDHWRQYSDPDEKEVMRRCGEISRLLALAYLIPINVALICFITTPLIPVVLDVINPLNESRPRSHPMYTNYIVDSHEYYNLIMLHQWIKSIVSVEAHGFSDTYYAQLIQHSCTLFAVVECHLERLRKYQPNSRNQRSRKRDDAIYKELSETVKLHKEAIEFATVLDSCFSRGLFRLIVFNTLLISCIAVNSMLNFEVGDLNKGIRMGILYVAFTWHLFYYNFCAQRIIDGSEHVQEAAFQSSWYNIPKKAKVLIYMMMMRSTRPCKITGFQVFDLNLEYFAK
ncbi:hypothetical protein QAD02_018528, partial [Eretmocerus hayati]